MTSTRRSGGGTSGSSPTDCGPAGSAPTPLGPRRPDARADPAHDAGGEPAGKLAAPAGGPARTARPAGSSGRTPRSMDLDDLTSRLAQLTPSGTGLLRERDRPGDPRAAVQARVLGRDLAPGDDRRRAELRRPEPRGARPVPPLAGPARARPGVRQRDTHRRRPRRGVHRRRHVGATADRRRRPRPPDGRRPRDVPAVGAARRRPSSS